MPETATEQQQQQPSAPTKGSAGRACSTCQTTKPRESYSGKQWDLNAKTRRCSECVLKNPKPQTKPEEKKNELKSRFALKAAKQQQQLKQAPVTQSKADGLQYSAEIRNRLKAQLPKATAVNGKPALLDAEGDWFVPGAEKALTEIFNRFDSNKDGAWNIADSQQFAVATNGKPFTTEELNEILQHFERGESGGWTTKGFLQFYHLQSSSHPDETWKDLIKLGYNKDFELTEKAKKEIAERAAAAK